MTGSLSRYCACLDPATGRQYGTGCPELTRSDKHGQWQVRDRVPTSKGTKEFRRRGFRTRKTAREFRDRLHELLTLGRGDQHATGRIGDLVMAVQRGLPLPAVEDVRRRLGLGGALDGGKLTGQYLREWLAGKKRLRPSVVRSYRQHIDTWLEPHLGHFPLDGPYRLSPEAIGDLFDMIGEMNEEIRIAQAEGRRPVLPGDTRRRAMVVGVATQRRIRATLRAALNTAVKRRLIDQNPALFVELPEEVRGPARTWDPDQVGRFLEATVEDRLHALYRLVLLHGPRRGEAVGARRAGFDRRTRSLHVIRPLLQLGGRIVEAPGPKTRAGERIIYLDEGTADLIHRDLVQRARERLEWGEAYQDHDLVWCREDGTPFPPDYVSRHFKELATAAGLPVIRLHEGRHSAASLRLEAGVDIKVVSEQLGHSTTTITRDLYMHVRRAVLDDATDRVVNLLPRQVRKARKATG